MPEEIWVPLGAETLTWSLLHMLMAWPCRQPVNRRNKKSCPTGFIPLQEAVLNSCQRCVWYAARVWVLFETKQCKYMACTGSLLAAEGSSWLSQRKLAQGCKQQEHVLAPV